MTHNLLAERRTSLTWTKSAEIRDERTINLPQVRRCESISRERREINHSIKENNPARPSFRNLSKWQWAGKGSVGWDSDGVSFSHSLARVPLMTKETIQSGLDWNFLFSTIKKGDLHKSLWKWAILPSFSSVGLVGIREDFDKKSAWRTAGRLYLDSNDFLEAEGD